MPGTSTAKLRQKVEQIARAPLTNIDNVIRSLDPTYDTHGAAQANQVESALATIVGEPEEAPVSSEHREAAARRIQSAWRRARKRSRSRMLIAELLANLVSMEILGNHGGRRLIKKHQKEREDHVKALGNPETKKALLPEITRDECRALVRSLVYLSNSARASYRVGFQEGRLIWRGANFDTSDMESHWSSEGRAIYVMDKQGHFYAAEQRLDAYGEHFHHSSFLSGAPVAGAGEMQVADGKLEVLTAQSGHYKPTHKEMLQTVRRLAANNVRFYRIAMWAEDWRSATDLRQKFSKAQLGHTTLPPDPNGPHGIYSAGSQPPEDDFPKELLQSPVTGQMLAVYIPAQEYLWNPAMQSLLLYDPTHVDMRE